ncbi:hypothetical protein OX90_08635 [Pseudomonas coronafaciens pv. porri]|uniref:DUF4276 family protein n=1 Tax=Pseudomonas coronafaciens pv. porri TaxID=83964 RepID=A0ABR5JR05_9PSED|nr:DUF4276 family protein [Pseudomonas coronafaciens]KOP59952.1 hypothetical protein OX90_08635 [Pseudomonas coronafaciens pv. porri]RMU80166.1 hypothetical protein ALP22_200205 [Pseudomonas coronafaciens pv. porri]
MVKAGFIVEGASERIVVESPMFRELLRACGYELVTPVVDAKGGGNLLPQNIDAFIARLDTAGAERIFVLTDLEDEAQVATVRERVAHQRIHFAFIAVKALEAWYLADGVAMNAWLGTDDFHEPNPEATPDKPWERLKQVATERGKRGPGSKVAFATKVTKHWGFTIENASAHPACPSAQELIEYFRTV